MLCFDCTFLDDVTSFLDGITSLLKLSLSKLTGLSKHHLASENLKDSFPYPHLIFKCKHISQILSFMEHSSDLPPPLHKGGVLTFSKLMEMGGGLKIFARKGGGLGNGGISV